MSPVCFSVAWVKSCSGPEVPSLSLDLQPDLSSAVHDAGYLATQSAVDGTNFKVDSERYCISRHREEDRSLSLEEVGEVGRTKSCT